MSVFQSSHTHTLVHTYRAMNALRCCWLRGVCHGAVETGSAAGSYNVYNERRTVKFRGGAAYVFISCARRVNEVEMRRELKEIYRTHRVYERRDGDDDVAGG